MKINNLYKKSEYAVTWVNTKEFGGKEQKMVMDGAKLATSVYNQAVSVMPSHRLVSVKLIA